MIVVDANVIMALVTESSHTPAARAIHARDPDWVVPSLWQFEVLNALLNATKARRIRTEDGLAAAGTAGWLLRGRTRDSRPSAILATAHALALTAYDAAYVELARSLGVFLITEDRQILRASPDISRSMRKFLEPPGAPPTVREQRAGYASGRKVKQKQ